MIWIVVMIDRKTEIETIALIIRADNITMAITKVSQDQPRHKVIGVSYLPETGRFIEGCERLYDSVLDEAIKERKVKQGDKSAIK